MKKMKKGFTIVELVIVIAVIAILAGVLIPTFTSVTENAKKSAALQEARNAYTIVYADALADDGVIDANDDTDGVTTDGIKIESGDFTFTVTNGEITDITYSGDKYADFSFSIEDGVITVE